MARARPERYRDLGPIIGQASLALSRLAHAEQKPSETAQAAFDLGVASLNDTPKSDLALVPLPPVRGSAVLGLQAGGPC